MSINTQPIQNFDCYTVVIKTTTMEETKRVIAQYADCTIKHPTEFYHGNFETIIENKNLNVYGAPK